MLRSLHGKLALLLLLVYGISSALYLMASLHAFETHQQETVQKYHRTLARHLVALSQAEAAADPDALYQACLMQKRFHPELNFYLLDAAGNILRATTDRIRLRRVDTRPIRTFLERSPMLPIRGDDPTMARHSSVFSAAALGPAGGYLYIVLSGPEFTSILNLGRDSYTMRVTLWYGLGGMLLALTTGFVAFLLITRRIVALSERMAAFRRDSLRDAGAPAFAPQPADEIERLENDFGDLTRRVERQMTSLCQIDRYRKDLIANVSHDLRTPIATLQGYLETLLLRGPAISLQEQRDFIEVAFRQGERLSKLIADLFELSKLDSGDPTMHVEPFAFAELVQDVAQKFSLKARQQGITLHATFPFDLPPVEGDIRLLERVLENLIQNALHHTPAGGSILLRLSAARQGIRVEVEDTGNGIPPEKQPYVFERYYRASGRRGDGAGLGLAIAKRVVELHTGRIGVSSRPGHGSTFWFELPRHHERPAPAPMRPFE